MEISVKSTEKPAVEGREDNSKLNQKIEKKSKSINMVNQKVVIGFL